MNADLEPLLKEAGKYVIPAKEPTLFAVGGRGYYENPASDLLAFFLKPDAEHGLGDLFLSTYLECMKLDPHQFKMSNVSVEREVVTEDHSRIDLRILGLDWCLLIENKIYHWQANPFTSYEDHAKGLSKETNIFSVLSPSGCIKKEGKKEDWKGVAYPDYCKALRGKMAPIFYDLPFSKWPLFAREFILHMENELYTPSMNPEQVAFVEQHADQIAEVQELAEQYQLFIKQELKRRLDESVPGCTFDIRPSTWPGHVLVLYCTCPQWRHQEMVLYKPEGTGQKFFIRAYLDNLSEPLLSQAKQALKHMKAPVVEGTGLYWSSLIGYDTRKEATDELCKLALKVNDILKQ